MKQSANKLTKAPNNPIFSGANISLLHVIATFTFALLQLHYHFYDIQVVTPRRFRFTTYPNLSLL